jgi:hypothetical protein
MKQVSACPLGTEKFTLTNLSGLWIAIGAAFGLSLIVWAIRKIFNLRFTYNNPFSEANTEKTQIFEEQLVRAVSIEVNSNYKNKHYLTTKNFYFRYSRSIQEKFIL